MAPKVQQHQANLKTTQEKQQQTNIKSKATQQKNSIYI